MTFTRIFLLESITYLNIYYLKFHFPSLFFTQCYHKIIPRFGWDSVQSDFAMDWCQHTVKPLVSPSSMMTTILPMWRLFRTFSMAHAEYFGVLVTIDLASRHVSWWSDPWCPSQQRCCQLFLFLVSLWVIPWMYRKGVG